MANEHPAGSAAGEGSSGLKLKALDEEDLKVISACLQDALVPIFDIAYQASEQRLVMVVSRFMWECDEQSDFPKEEVSLEHRVSQAGEKLHYRVHCGVTFEKVLGVKSIGVNRQEQDQLLNILAITADSRKGGVTLYFSGGAAIHLDVAQLRCFVKDIGEPWPIFSVPRHEAG